MISNICCEVFMPFGNIIVLCACSMSDINLLPFLDSFETTTILLFSLQCGHLSHIGHCIFSLLSLEMALMIFVGVVDG